MNYPKNFSLYPTKAAALMKMPRPIISLALIMVFPFLAHAINPPEVNHEILVTSITPGINPVDGTKVCLGASLPVDNGTWVCSWLNNGDAYPSPASIDTTVAGWFDVSITWSSECFAPPPALKTRPPETRRIAVVKIDKLEYENSSGAWVDATSGIIYVSQGTTLNFKAVPTPLVWPDGMPVWSGTSGAGGGSVTKSITFNTVSTSSTDYKTVSATCGNTKTAKIIVLKVEFDSVVAADFIGESSGNKVYATAQAASPAYVLIKLKTTPSGVVLPSDFVTWSGGASGGNPLSRLLSKDSLIESGASVSAVVADSASIIFSGSIYVFKGKLTDANTICEREIISGAVCEPEEFGCTTHNHTYFPSTFFYVYYEDIKWKFAFIKVHYKIEWGIQNRGRADVVNGSASPFPVGLNVPTASTESQKRSIARTDLSPDSTGRPVRNSYWSSSLTTAHEMYHVNDYDGYYVDAMGRAESTVESGEDVVTLSNLDPGAVYTSHLIGWGNVVFYEALGADTAYNSGGNVENRAYSAGAAGYQALVNSIP